MNNYGRGAGRPPPSQYSNNSRHDDVNDRQDQRQQFSTAQSTANGYDRRPLPSNRDEYDRRPPPSNRDEYDRRPPPSNRDEYDRRPPPSFNDRRSSPESNVRRPPPSNRDEYDRRPPPASVDRRPSPESSVRRPPPSTGYGAAARENAYNNGPPSRGRDDFLPPRESSDVRQLRGGAMGGGNVSPRGGAGGYDRDESRPTRGSMGGGGGYSRNIVESDRGYATQQESDYGRPSPSSSIRGRPGAYDPRSHNNLTNSSSDYNNRAPESNDRRPPPSTGYGVASRDSGYNNAPPSRGRDDYEPPRGTFDSRQSYSDRPMRGGGMGGGYGGAGGYDRDESRAARGGPTTGGYGESRPTRGGMGSGGGYNRASNNDEADRGYANRQENGYGRPPQSSSIRGGRPGAYEPRSNDYNNRRDDSNEYNNDRSGYGNPRGGYSTSNRGSFSTGRGGGSRYDDRRSENTGYSGYNSGGNTGYSGYSGYGGNNQFDDGRKERTAENHAPRDYRPVERNIDDIFEEDKEDIKKNTATIFDADADVKVEEASVDMHCDTWDDMNLHESLMANIIKSDYIKPRKIQQKTIPYVLEGYDVKCQGETGSGKTASFLIPVIQKMLEQREEGQLTRDGPICIIVAPTRELVSQIYEQALKFSHNTGITVARAYGEYNMMQNRNDIRKGCNILCACIGRLMHFVEESTVKLEYLKFLILDEADRLLMERNNSDIMKLFNYPELPSKETLQMLLFSATLRDPMVMELTQSYMKTDKCVLITATCQSNKRVIYKIYAVPSAPAKFKYLVKYMKQITEENGGEVPRTLIFVNKKINTDRVAIECTSNGFPATTIHGDRGQHLREEALSSFRTGKTRCLVATDVCARGVDIKEMDHVINYDLPTDKDGFIQRSGRTGRTHKGVAMSFYFENDDRSMATDIARIIQQNGQESPAFLDSYVQESDYNFGIPEPEAPVNGYQSNGYGRNINNDNDEWGTPPPSGIPYHDQSRQSSNREETAETAQQSSAAVINDSTAEDDWD